MQLVVVVETIFVSSLFYNVACSFRVQEYSSVEKVSKNITLVSSELSWTFNAGAVCDLLILLLFNQKGKTCTYLFKNYIAIVE